MSKLRDKRLRCLRRRVDRLERTLIPRATAEQSGTLSFHREELAALQWALSELEELHPESRDQIIVDARANALRVPENQRDAVVGAFMAGYHRRQIGVSFTLAQQALDLIVSHGDTEGEHHKAWVIDQVARILAGDRYAEVVAKACDGEDGPETYVWDVGVAP